MIYWDQNDNGPDSTDQPPVVGNAYGQCNFNTFPLNGAEILGVPGAFFCIDAFTIVTTTPQPSRYYIVVTCRGVIWTSAVFTIANGLNEYDLTEGWTCAETFAPCDEPTYIYVETVGGADYWADGPHYSCLSLCANTPVQICYGPLSQDVIPNAAVRSGCSYQHEGCNTECPPASFTFDNSAWTYDNVNSRWCNLIIPGDADGCVCLEDFFSVPPPCDEPPYINVETVGGVDYWADGPHYSCVSLCANTPVQICYGPLSQDVIPNAAVRSGCSYQHEGCNTECPPASFTFDNSAWTYDNVNSRWCNWIIPGEADGCVCLEDFFSVPPPCDEPAYINVETVGGMDYWADGPHYSCVSLCANTPVQICYGPLSQDVIPYAAVRSGCFYQHEGCNTECPPASFTFNNSAWTYDDVNSRWCNWIFPGDADGCVCLEDFFSVTPPCDEPTYIYVETVGGMDYWADGPHYSCVSLCANTPVQICYGPLSPDVFVLADLYPGCSHGIDGCNTECPPALLAFIYEEWTYDELNGLWCNWIYPDYQSGCVCLADYFDHTIGFVELYFEAHSRDNAALITWATASESGIDYFRLVRDGQLVHTVAGTNSSTGSTYSYLDENLVNGRTYSYSIEVVSPDGTVETWSRVVLATPSASSAVISDYALHQNYPNPFNPSTNLVFDVVAENNVNLVVYNAMGQEVATLVNGTVAAGRHTVSFDAANLTSGLYFYTVKIGNEFTATKKMLLVK